MAIATSNMHKNISLVTGRGVVKFHQVGLLASLDSKKDYGNSGFIENAVENLHEILKVTGTVLSGYVHEKSENVVTTYVFYKADVLPARLSMGLVQEYKEFMEKNKKVTFSNASIETISINDSDEIMKFTLDDLGLGELIQEEKKEKKVEPENILAALNDFDFTL